MKFQDAFMVKSIKLLNVSWSFHPPPSWRCVTLPTF
jgi:hypothetical protein